MHDGGGSDKYSQDKKEGLLEENMLGGGEGEQKHLPADLEGTWALVCS